MQWSAIRIKYLCTFNVLEPDFYHKRFGFFYVTIKIISFNKQEVFLMKKYNIAIVGATGMVGRTFLKVLEEVDLPAEATHCWLLPAVQAQS